MKSSHLRATITGVALLALTSCSRPPMDSPHTTPTAQVAHGGPRLNEDLKPTPSPTPEENPIYEIPGLGEGNVGASPGAEIVNEDGSFRLKNDLSSLQNTVTGEIIDPVAVINVDTLQNVLRALQLPASRIFVHVTDSQSGVPSIRAVVQDPTFVLGIEDPLTQDLNYEILFMIIRQNFTNLGDIEVHQRTAAMIHAANGLTYDEYVKHIREACEEGFSADCDGTIPDVLYDEFQQYLLGSGSLYQVLGMQQPAIN